MLKTPPTIESLKNAGATLIESGKKQLKDSKDLMPVIKLGDAADGSGDTILGVTGEVMNSDKAKEKLASHVKELIAKHGYFHSIFMSDTFQLMSRNKEEGELIVALREMGIPSVTIAEKGLGKLREQITVMIEAVGTKIQMACPYERDADGNVTSFGEIEETTGVTFSGRFVFFD